MRTIPLLALVACHREPASCDPSDPAACGDGLACEEILDAEPQCVPPVRIEGRVFSLEDDAAVASARVVAIDPNGSPVSRVAISGDDGGYAIPISTPRDEDGVPRSGRQLTLRADAAGFESYPGGVRPALPIDTEDPVAQDDGSWVVRSAATDVGLLPVADGAGTGTIVGTAAADGGVLVVGEGSDTGGADPGAVSAIAGLDGSFALFNLAPGTWQVSGYARGATYGTATAEVPDGGEAEVTLERTGDATGTLTGNVQIVNAPGGSSTSIVLVVESTFDDVLERGAVPPGLRAPDPGTPPTVSGSFAIQGVPPGRYVVLAAFENDGLVRDPDESIGGTQIQHVEVTAGGTTTTEGFKITEALPVFGPGASEPEAVSSAPTLSWADDSSEDEYDVRVFDAYGNVVWEVVEPRHTGDDPAVPYGGPLDPGMYYQFRVRSVKDGTFISATEDLRGVFFVE